MRTTTPSLCDISESILEVDPYDLRVGVAIRPREIVVANVDSKLRAFGRFRLTGRARAEHERNNDDDRTTLVGLTHWFLPDGLPSASEPCPSNRGARD